jgi:hypothetical protein
MSLDKPLYGSRRGSGRHDDLHPTCVKHADR